MQSESGDKLRASASLLLCVCEITINKHHSDLQDFGLLSSTIMRTHFTAGKKAQKIVAGSRLVRIPAFVVCDHLYVEDGLDSTFAYWS
jgi:hypothetical protein